MDFIHTMIGRWWTKDAEIDVVALDEEASTAWFGECKWSASKVGEDVYEGLVRKSKLVDWRNGARTERYMLFSDLAERAAQGGDRLQPRPDAVRLS